MYTLLISIFAIVLEALCLFALLSASPNWAKTAPDISRVIAAGLSTGDMAFYRYAAANNGAALAPTAATDGGLSNFRSPVAYSAFTPPAPLGYAWKYGKDNALNQYYLCMYSVSGAPVATEDVYRAMKRLQRLLPWEQYVIHPGPNTTCGVQSAGSLDPASVPTDLAAPSVFPANLTVTYWLKYLPNQKPASSALPCQETSCLGSPQL